MGFFRELWETKPLGFMFASEGGLVRPEDVVRKDEYPDEMLLTEPMEEVLLLGMPDPATCPQAERCGRREETAGTDGELTFLGGAALNGVLVGGFAFSVPVTLPLLEILDACSLQNLMWRSAAF